MKITRDITNRRVVIHPACGEDVEVHLHKLGNIRRNFWTCKPCPAFVKLWGDHNLENRELRELGFQFRSFAGAWIILFNPKWLSTRKLTKEVRDVMESRLDYNTITDAGERGRFYFISGYLNAQYPDRSPGELAGITMVVHGYIEDTIPKMLEGFVERALCSS